MSKLAKNPNINACGRMKRKKGHKIRPLLCPADLSAGFKPKKREGKLLRPVVILLHDETKFEPVM